MGWAILRRKRGERCWRTSSRRSITVENTLFRRISSSPVGYSRKDTISFGSPLSTRCRVCHAMSSQRLPRIKIVPTFDRGLTDGWKGSREEEKKKGKGKREDKEEERGKETGFLWRVSCKQSSRHRLITNGGRGAWGDRLITRLRLYVFQRWSNATDSLCTGMASNPKDRVVHVVKTTSRRISRGCIEVCTWKMRGDDGIFLGAKILKGSRKCYHFAATAV